MDAPPLDLLRPGRAVRGMSAVLLPHRSGTEIDWPAFEAHVERTATAGLTPAVNMDTGYHLAEGVVHRLPPPTDECRMGCCGTLGTFLP